MPIGFSSHALRRTNAQSTQGGRHVAPRTLTVSAVLTSVGTAAAGRSPDPEPDSVKTTQPVTYAQGDYRHPTRMIPGSPGIIRVGPILRRPG